jgi:hypothetical protein
MSATGLKGHFVAKITYAIAHSDSVRNPWCAHFSQRGADVFLLGPGGIDQSRAPDHQ